MSNSHDHNVPYGARGSSRHGAHASKRDLRYKAVGAPQAYQGIGWALSRAYPTSGHNLPADMVAMLEKLDASDKERRCD